MSGSLVGDYRQREVLPLGLSVCKYQRYALDFQTLRKKRNEANIFGATTHTRHYARQFRIPNLI